MLAWRSSVEHRSCVRLLAATASSHCSSSSCATPSTMPAAGCAAICTSAAAGLGGNAGDDGAVIPYLVRDIKTRRSLLLVGIAGRDAVATTTSRQTRAVQVGGWRRANNDVLLHAHSTLSARCSLVAPLIRPGCSDVLAAYVIRSTPRPQIRPTRPLPTLALALYANHRALAGRRGTTHAATLPDLLGGKV